MISLSGISRVLDENRKLSTRFGKIEIISIFVKNSSWTDGDKSK